MADDARRIRAELTDARALCDALGLLDGRPGRDWMRQMGGVMIRCPWHDERSPSCSVVTRGGSIGVRCFGCDATGDALSLIAEVMRLDIRRAFFDVLDVAADIAGVPRPSRRDDEDRPATYIRPVSALPRVAEPTAEEDPTIIPRIAAVLAEVAPVSRSPQALRYLEARGLGDSVARGWYALPDLDARGPIVRAITDAVGFEAWLASGLASVEGERRGLWSFAWNLPRLVIPWRDPDGEVRTLQGRVLGPCPERVRKYVFARGRAPAWPYGCHALREVCGGDTAVAVVEGVLDALSFDALAARHGVDAVALAVPGVSAWRDEWLPLFARRPCIVALDADAAGDRATGDILAALRSVARRGPRGPLVEVRRPAQGKDWNEVLCSARGAA